MNRSDVSRKFISDKFKEITEQKPFIYGSIYLGLIPFFAIIFYILPAVSFRLSGHTTEFTTYLYFSVITITTLGYGDITPLGAWSEMLTALESILGIGLIGLFLNSLSHQHTLEVQEGEKKLHEDEKHKLNIERFCAFNKLIELKIEGYLKYVTPMTIPAANRVEGDTGKVNENFIFNDMKELFIPSLQLADDMRKPVVAYYFKSLLELTSSLEEMVKLGYIQHWPEMEILCLEFIEKAKSLDASEFILVQPTYRLGNGKLASDHGVDLIESHKGEPKYLSGNLLNPYIALYKLIKEGQVFIREYRKLAKNIKGS